MALAGRIRREILGVLAVFAGLYVGTSLFTYDKWDPSLLTYTAGESGNYGGSFGAYIADVLSALLGFMAFAVPVFFVFYGARRLFGATGRRLYLAGTFMFFLAGSVLLYLLGPSFTLGQKSGGLIGLFVGAFISRHLSVAGTYVLMLSGFLASIVMLVPGSLVSRIDELLRRTDPGRGEDQVLSTLISDDDTQGRQAKTVSSLAGLSGFFRAFTQGSPAKSAPEPEEPLPFDTGADDLLKLDSPIGDAANAVGQGKPLHQSRFRLPSLDILKTYEHERPRTSEDIGADAELLESRLGEFSVKGRVTKVHVGPVVSMCEFEPAAGVKMNKVISLADDLALGLKAQSVRISPVPGKSTIGIEIPNKNREMVSLRELIASEKFQENASLLTIAMGKDIFGKPVVADLARMPHLLVAGATGSGKSVFMNSIIMSLMYKAGPDQVKMLMIDPKLLELSSYDGIPHLLAPVVTSPKDASEMLRRMVFEMERRYRVLAEKGVRNIDGYNDSVPDAERLPYIVVLIDELADLMLASSAQVEDSIARLAQMARAAGIHLILATQRPSVDVITGVIKANFPARVAFQVTSGTDSRTIIGSQGAEQLIGRGDMIFMLPGVKMLRVHGAFVTESEVNEAVNFCRSQGAPDFSIIEEITEAEEESRAESAHTGDRDDLFWNAVEYAEAAGEVSISSIQRKMKIGYNRAARIMELMEDDGMVGPPKGAGKPRDFLGRGRG